MLSRAPKIQVQRPQNGGKCWRLWLRNLRDDTVTQSGHIETDCQLTADAVTDLWHCPAIPGNPPIIKVRSGAAGEILRTFTTKQPVASGTIPATTFESKMPVSDGGWFNKKARQQPKPLTSIKGERLLYHGWPHCSNDPMGLGLFITVQMSGVATPRRPVQRVPVGSKTSVKTVFPHTCKAAFRVMSPLL